MACTAAIPPHPQRLCATAQDYNIAQPGYTFAFPRDYFNHEDYQTEWWYYTGNVKAADGHRFGFELTFFRQGVSRAANSRPWFVHDLWMAHIALSDVTGQRFYSEERLNRSGPGVAGVDAQTGLVWNGNWQAQISEQSEELRGVADKFSLALQLRPVKQPVIQGQDGVSRKAEGAGHASHYFSLPRLLTAGSIALNGKTYQVEGTSWIDHEFFTGSMAANETGWDWLSVQLADGAELMLYRLRHKDGSIDPSSSGSYVDASREVSIFVCRGFRNDAGGRHLDQPGDQGDVSSAVARLHSAPEHAAGCNHAAAESGTGQQIRDQLLGGSHRRGWQQRSVTVTRSWVPRDDRIRRNGQACHPQLILSGVV